LISAPSRGPYWIALESRLPKTPVRRASSPGTTGMSSTSTFTSRARISAPSISTQSLSTLETSTAWRWSGS
jgi:hypothetical protein